VLHAIFRYLGRHHVALLALFVALGGTAAAATFIKGTQIKPGSLPENRLTAAAAASFTADEALVYCRAARARPGSYVDGPCRARTEIISDGGNVWGIAIGTDGNPVVTNDSHPTELIRCDDPLCAGGAETTQEINGTYCGSGSGDLAITSTGLPIVAEWNGGCVEDGHLNVASCLDPSCSTFNENAQTFDPQGTGRFSSIAIGRTGNPIISHYDSANGDLRVLHCDDPICTGSGETSSAVATTDDVGRYTSIAIGRNGNAVIAYYDATHQDLKVARCNDRACAGSNETISTVDSAGDVGEFASLTIGANGNPVIAYYKRSTGDLRVARCNDPACMGGNETRTTVASSGDVGQFASLGLGLDGRPAVAFFDLTNEDLRLARCNDAACAGGNEKMTTLDSAGSVGQYASLAIGLDGIPIVAYLDATNAKIKVARPSVLP
jgi:hypothetical protein